MKILMIDTSPTGGIAHYTYNLCEALGRAGCEVRLLTHRDYELSDFPRTFSLVTGFYQERPYLKSLSLIFREWLTFRPDAVHFQTLVSTRKDWILFMLLRSIGARIVLTAHNLLPHEVRLFEETTYRWMYRLSSKIIVHAEQNRKEFFNRFSLPREKVRVIPHGSYAFFRSGNSPGRESSRRKLGIPVDDGVILFFGAIRPYKGLKRLIRSFSELVREGRQVCLIIAGKVLVGSEEEYRRAIREAGIESRVFFRPEYVPFEEVADYFTAADMTALPYDHIYDSGVLHIAFAFGVPVVATAVGAFLDYVEDGKTGLLVPPGEEKGLARALKRLLDDRPLCRRLGKNARALDAEYFNWDRIAVATRQLYGELKGPPGRGESVVRDLNRTRR